MSLELKCSRCEVELHFPGGLYFSPPKYDIGSIDPLVRKMHLCSKCSEHVEQWILHGGE